MKQRILCAVGAAVVLLGIAAGAIFGSDTPIRWILTDAGGGSVNVSATGAVTFELDSPYRQVRAHSSV